MHTFLIVPAGMHAGLTSASVGLVHSLDRLGMRVGFFKPISQSYDERGSDLSSEYVRAISAVEAPDPISVDAAREWTSTAHTENLLEEIVSRFQTAAEGMDVMVVEGLHVSHNHAFLNSLNPKLARALNADVILVSNCQDMDAAQLNQHIESAGEPFGGAASANVIGCILNQVKPSELLGPRLDDTEQVNWAYNKIIRQVTCFRKEHLHLLGVIPFRESLTSFRTSDLIRPLEATVLFEGEIDTRRVSETHLCARDISHLPQVYHAGSLVVTPADRSDVIIGCAYAAQKGIQLAGLILTGDLEPNQNVLDFCGSAFETGLPVMAVKTTSFETARNLTAVSPEIPADDVARLQQLVGHIARHIDTGWMENHCSAPQKIRLSPPAFRHLINQKARSNPKRIVLPEGCEPRTLEAAVICHRRKIAEPVLIGSPEEVNSAAKKHGIALPSDIEILDPVLHRARYVSSLYELRKHKGMTPAQAESTLEDNITLATMMLAKGDVDGLVSGAIHSTADTIRPALQLIKKAPSAAGVSSVFFMCLPKQVLVYGDCAVNLDPKAELLADIAIQSAESAVAFGIEPRIAMISYSTLGSGGGADVEKVIEATKLVRERRPDLLVDGPLQYDAASNSGVAKTKAPDSEVAGRATVFVFPDLNTGNTTYKAVQRSANVVSVGPVLQGLRKPVNDLSRGANVDDIVFTIAITSIQAQQAQTV
ncbi:phosphate acetyltransferase [Persicirhabdus sediminis]|nr:phosphate acetyltransferase [Persicirhabdus sediminis]